MHNFLKKFSRYNTFYRIFRNIYYYVIVRPYCNIAMLFYNLKIALILNGIINEDERYKKIKELKGIHQGERCFIVATGPSVKMEDLELIKNEITISMNSIVNVLDDTSFRPTYYMLQDYGTFKRIYENFKKLPSQTIKFIGINNLNIHHYKKYKNIIEPDNNIYFYRLNSAKTKKYGNLSINKTKIGFSWDCWKEIIDGYMVTYSAIQLAVWMGISEIYLIGCDCNYSQKINHIGEYMESNHEYSNKAEARMMKSYECAYDNLKGKVKIYNATRGGKLEIFPRVDFEKMFD